MPARNAKHSDFVREHFGTIWPVHLSAFTTLLKQLRTHFDGDLDLLLVLAVIGERTRPDTWSPELLTYRQLTRDEGDEHLQEPINVQSVADYSGIPRETVRRKVGKLLEKGWITRDGAGRLAVARSAAADLEAATGDTIDYLAAILTAGDAARSRKGQSGG